jgi:TPR repeat protein
MAFMHEQRCIHRDLKPPNVLLDERCEPRIADFGLSKYVEKGATLSQSMHGGTSQFMAPELHLGDRFDFSVDVYAFGMLMFATLTGLDPFPDCPNAFILAKRVTDGERPTIPESVGRGYAGLMRRCWQTAPAGRPSFPEIVNELGQEACLEGLDLKAVQAYQVRVCPPSLVPPMSAVFAERSQRIRRPTPALAPIEELRRLADSGDARAQVQFGQKLERGEEIPQDCAAAVRYYRMAADREWADGLVALGRCLQDGIGATADQKAAVALFRRAHTPDSFYHLATCLLRGLGCFRDYAEGIRLLKAAADAGHGLAANDLGDRLERGDGVPMDIAEALRYYRISSDFACPIGMFSLADMYHHGKHVREDIPEAIRLYKLAADAGVAQAFFAICEVCQQGVLANLQRVWKWQSSRRTAAISSVW